MGDVVLPKLNNNDSEYLLVEWLVGDGAPVRAGEAVAVVETSKAASDLEAVADGVLAHLVPAGTWCAPGAVLARVTLPGASTPGPAVPLAGAGSAGPVITEPARRLMAELGVTEAEVAALGVPLVRRGEVEAVVARRDQAPGSAVPLPTDAAPEGTPGGGTWPPERDLGGAASPPERALGGAATLPEAGRGGAVELSRVQRAVARAVTVSHQSIPAAYTVMRFDVGEALVRAEELTRSVRRPIGLAELTVAALARLHERFPLCYATLDGDRAWLAETPHVGVTFDLGEGLFVPVVHDPAGLSWKELATTMMRYRVAAGTGRFAEADLAGATITLTLHTEPDVVLAVPFVFPGQVCALALTAPREEGGRTVADVGLAYDHRLINGRDAARFLTALKQEVTTP
ncbi:2-oxo acid dehydrogenase subunit E2 [Nonomuraea sp. NPDC050310]|uniref:2-oxo acid dehydrogenase subunit E2 n=1 Tax=unclassified Nonomuraea TaxID=2593643 RepID=UPI0033FBECC9